MATDTRANRSNLGVDSQYREWIAAIDAALLACGLVKTGDTGQLDIATILKPGSTQTMNGYYMYRFDDALQATKPVFIRVDFGTGITTTCPGISVRVGTATNGAGGFNGITASTTRTLLAQSAGAANGTLNQYASGSQAAPGGGRIWMTSNFDPANANLGFHFGVERLKNGDGTVHSSGAFALLSLSGQSGNQVGCQTLVHGQTPGNSASFPIIDVTHVQQAPNVGTDLALAPMMFALGVWLYLLPLGYRDADLARLVAFTMTHLGAARTFLPLGPNLAGGVQFVNGPVSAVFGLAIPWE